jgi:putative tryptophan/tyrosine transport system substrate-binding protein
MIRRREFVAGLGSAAAWPLAAQAQQGARRHVGVLMNVAKGDSSGLAEVAAFRQGLAELGWVEGRTVGIEVRWSGLDLRAEALAKELVALKPDVLLSRGTPATAAFKQETGAIPIVFVGVFEPVEQGIVQSWARPGGNITGFTNFEASIGGKWVQLLKEVDPRVVRIGIIYNPQTAPLAGSLLRSVETAAPRVGVEVIALPVQSEVDIAAALKSLAQRAGSALVQILDPYTLEHRDVIIELAARLHLPALYSNSSAASSGGLMAYGVDIRDLMHRAAGYIDRILKGEKPAELAVQQPTRFNLVINLKTAKALGLTVPQTLLVSADEVIE